VTARLAVPDTDPRVAVTVAFPGPTVVARPSVGAELLTVATVTVEELQ